MKNFIFIVIACFGGNLWLTNCSSSSDTPPPKFNQKDTGSAREIPRPSDVPPTTPTDKEKNIIDSKTEKNKKMAQKSPYKDMDCAAILKAYQIEVEKSINQGRISDDLLKTIDDPWVQRCKSSQEYHEQFKRLDQKLPR